MDELDQFERSLAAALRSDADLSVAQFEPARIARAAVAGRPKRSVRIRSRFIIMPTFARPAAVAAMLGVVAVAGALVLFRPSQPTVGEPSPTPAPSPSVQGVVAPTSPNASELPGPSAGPTSSPVANPAGVRIPTGSMGTPRSEHSAVRLLDGRVLVMGGVSAADDDLTSSELYDPATGTWTATAKMIGDGGGTATLLRDGKVLVTGDGAQLYDPATGTWTATAKMIGDGGRTATLLRDGTVLVRGDGGSELFDPDSGTWTATRSRAAQRHSHAAILLPDGKVLVAGGHVEGDTPTDSAELYDPDTGSWTPIANMHAKRETIGAFLQPDGKVLVVGGSGRVGGQPPSAELYDPATGAWTAVGDVSTRGVSEILTWLADGTVLMTGGGGIEREAGLYDPDAGSWTTIAPPTFRYGTSAILLLDGTVLMSGGKSCLDGVCVATGSAELYVPRGVSPPPLPAFPSPLPPVFPSPTPTPTPFAPAVGPVPPGARSWEVTVVNKSAKLAALFLAEDGENGIGQLCGSVTPNVVPAGVTEKVTFLLPPKKVTDCWIWVNPVPGQGGSFFQTSDAPLTGQFLITADGQAMWGGS